MGKALEDIAQVLKMDVMGDRALPPVLVLVSDGIPTDNFGDGLKKLMNEPWGKKAVRVAIGHDADHEPLLKFIGNPRVQADTGRQPPGPHQVDQVALHHRHQGGVDAGQPGQGQDEQRQQRSPAGAATTVGAIGPERPVVKNERRSVAREAVMSDIAADRPRPTWEAFGRSVRGASHVRSGAPNQDAFHWEGSSGRTGPRVILAIADGHGSKKSFRSEQGARFRHAHCRRVAPRV